MRLMGAETIRQASASGWALGLGRHLRAGRIFLALGTVLLAAAVARWWGLGTQSLWFDEAYGVFIAQQPLLEIPRLLEAYDTHPPFHYVFLHVWMALFGTGEVAIRLPSVIASVGVVALTFLLARRVAGDRVGILAAILIAFSPFQITAAREARMYPFLTLFGLGGSYALWLALEEGRRQRWLVYLLLMLLALYTHHFALLLVLAHGVYVLAVHRTRAASGAWLRWTAVAAIAFLPLAPMLFAQLTTARAWPDIRPSFGMYALTDVLGLFSFGGGLFGMGTYFQRGTLPLEYRAAILFSFVLVVVCGVAGLGERRKRAFVLGYWLLPVLTVSVISLKWNVFYERYFSFILPPFAILLAAGVFYLADAMRRPAKAVAFVSLLALLASFNLPALADVYRSQETYDWRGAAQYVTARARADDFILFIPAFTRIPFEYNFQGPQARMGLNPPEVLAVHQRAAQGKLKLRTSVAPEQMAVISRKHPRMWTIASVALGSEVHGRIAQALAPYFRQVDGKTFGLVRASLWESRHYVGAPGRP
jgi:4-amino-4-deoxy-L-arabinose transferase-like glycosyltransferase